MLFFLLACLSPEADSGLAEGCLEPNNCDGDHIAYPYDCDDNDPSYAASQPSAYYPDLDGDGLGSLEGGEGFCADPGLGWVENHEDCDDEDSESGGRPCEDK